MSPIRLLLVSGANLVGQNVLAALATRRTQVWIAATGTEARDLALFDFDAVYLAPPTADSRRFEQRMLEIIADAQVDLIVPCRDEDVAKVSEFAHRHAKTCPRVLCGAVDAARIICDKWESHEFAGARGLPFAPTLVSGPTHAMREFIDRHGFPLVAKPRDGFGSRGVFLLVNEDQVRAALARPNYVVQRFLGDRAAMLKALGEFDQQGVPLFFTFEGMKRGMQLLIAPDGSLAGVLCTRQRMRQGGSDRVEVDDDPHCHALARQCGSAFAAAGWRGPLNIQCREAPDGSLHIHEFNGRFTGITEARRLLGYDEVALAIRHFLGREIAQDQVVSTAFPSTVRVLTTRAPNAARLDALERAGCWRAPAK